MKSDGIAKLYDNNDGEDMDLQSGISTRNQRSVSNKKRMTKTETKTPCTKSANEKRTIVVDGSIQVRGKEQILRMSFLEQAALLLAQQSTSIDDTPSQLSKIYVKEIREISYAELIQLDTQFKRNICKKCFRIWAPVAGKYQTMSFRKGRKRIYRKCLDCGNTTGFVADPKEMPKESRKRAKKRHRSPSTSSDSSPSPSSRHRKRSKKKHRRSSSSSSSSTTSSSSSGYRDRSKKHKRRKEEKSREPESDVNAQHLQDWDDASSSQNPGRSESDPDFDENLKPKRGPVLCRRGEFSQPIPQTPGSELIIDHVGQVFQCGIGNNIGLNQIFVEQMSSIKQLLMGKNAKIQRKNKSTYFRITEVINLRGKVLRKMKQKFGAHLRHPEWPFLVTERSPRKRKRSKRKLRKEISREVDKQLRRRERSCSVMSSRTACCRERSCSVVSNRKERSCSVVSNRATNGCASAKASRSPSVEIMWENVDNSLPNATRNTSSGYGTDWDQWDEQPPNPNPPTNKDSSSSGPLTVSEFFLREEQNPGPSQAASNTSNVYALDYLCEAFDCGFINKAENLNRVFSENMPVVQQLLIGATAKVLQHGYSIYFNIADVMIPDAETDKLLHHPGKQQFGNKQYYKNWPYLVRNKDDVTEGCFPIETVYLVKD
ncbi:RNAse P rpr2/Rpp21/SNM1 subunit domain-containing protein [Ditylenchus destructor]|nr:RNAse P rpr2/Rpp21/SNM1 subunit domain-containing protein [Ditylenchus destructor]